MQRKLIYSLFLLLIMMAALAQTPDHYPPTVPRQVDVSLFNLILYIVLPIGIVAAWFWYQRSLKNKQRKKREERGKGNDRH
jgi:hypothetical protein